MDPYHRKIQVNEPLKSNFSNQVSVDQAQRMAKLQSIT